MESLDETHQALLWLLGLLICLFVPAGYGIVSKDDLLTSEAKKAVAKQQHEKQKRLIQFASEPGKVNDTVLKEHVQLFVLTAPLILAVFVCTLATLRSWIGFEDDSRRAILFVCGSLIAALLLSNFLAIGIGPVRAKPLIESAGGTVFHKMIALSINILFAYFQTYKARFFFLAVAAGVVYAVIVNARASSLLSELDHRWRLRR